MKMNRRSFKFENEKTEFIKKLFSKISRGQFQIDQVKWNGESASSQAKVTVMIHGALPKSEFGTIQNHRSSETETSSGSGNDEKLTPDQKRIQEQVANCYR